MVKVKEYIDVYWDNELDPPSWVIRRVEEQKDGSLVVQDSDLANNKRDAMKRAKEWSQRSGIKLEKVISYGA
jgi:hypothetical protein